MEIAKSESRINSINYPGGIIFRYPHLREELFEGCTDVVIARAVYLWRFLSLIL